MALSVTCDACGKAIHTHPDERKFRVDFFAPKVSQGFDVCEPCWLRLRKEIKVA